MNIRAKTVFFVWWSASSLAVLAATSETAVIWDRENSPYAKAIRAGEAGEWGRFQYWVEMIPEDARDSKIKDWLSQLAAKENPPLAKETRPPATTSGKPDLSVTMVRPYVDPLKEYVGPLEAYVVRSGDYMAKISRRYGVSFRLLMEINGLKREVLRVGQTLLVPVNVTAKCQVRIAAYTKGKGVNSNGILAKEYVSVDLAKTLPDGISQYRYYKGNGVFDLLLCSEAASDEMFHLKVSSRNLTAAKDVFAQFQEGARTIEVEVK